MAPATRSALMLRALPSLSSAMGAITGKYSPASKCCKSSGFTETTSPTKPISIFLPSTIGIIFLATTKPPSPAVIPTALTSLPSKYFVIDLKTCPHNTVSTTLRTSSVVTRYPPIRSLPKPFSANA